MTIDSLTGVYVGNLLGIALLLVLFFSNLQRIGEDKDLKLVSRLLVIIFFACLADPIVYTVDGHPGILNTIIIYVGNTWLYLANMLTGIFWVQFLTNHIGLQLSEGRKVLYGSLFGFGALGLITNIFYPIVFTVTDNVYHRSCLYSLYVLIAVFYIVDCSVLYMKAKRKGGILTFFPIKVFLVPITVGIIVQTILYGISVIWPSVAIGIAGVMAALQNEIIYTDPLTGIHNRFFLEHLQKRISKNEDSVLTGVMVDLNGFKSINDRFGHAAGDEALVISSEILVKVVKGAGIVTRYAGDEFVILLNTKDENIVRQMIVDMNQAFEDFNRKREKPYVLSASAGYSVLDMANQTMSEFMNTIDMKMYQNKLEYYNSHK